jgi:hypothetical protein
MKFRVAILDDADHSVFITITGGDDVLYNRSIGKAPFESVFNLSDLEDGDYQLLVSCGKERVTPAAHHVYSSTLPGRHPAFPI